MSEPQLKSLGIAVIAAVLVASGFATAWLWQANAYDTVIARHEASRQADLALIANAGAKQARDALAKQHDAERRLAQLDKSATDDKGKLNDENDALRPAVADGTRRLRIAGSCRAGHGNVPSTAGATGLGDAGTVELAPGTGQRILNIRAGIIADQAALKAAQSYIRDVCQ